MKKLLLLLALLVSSQAMAQLSPRDTVQRRNAMCTPLSKIASSSYWLVVHAGWTEKRVLALADSPIGRKAARYGIFRSSDMTTNDKAVEAEYLAQCREANSV